MIGNSIIIEPNDGIRADTHMEYDNPNILTQMQEAVGGYVERVPEFTTLSWNDETYVGEAYVNEEGRLIPLQFNLPATRIFRDQLFERYGEENIVLDMTGIYGPVLFIWGDDEFMQSF